MFNRFLSILCSLAFVFYVTYQESPNNVNLKRNFHVKSDGEWSQLRYHLKDRIGSPGKLLKTGKGDLPPSDPMDLSSLWFVFDDHKGYLNSSLHNVKVHGLSRLSMKDTAFNEATKELSVLFSVPLLSVTGDYSIKHRRGDNLVDDQGKLHLKLNHWYTTWFSRVLKFNLTSDELTVGRISVKSYFDNVTKEFTSSSDYIGTDLITYSHTIETITSMLSNKVQSEVDDRLNLLLSQYINEEPTTISEMLRIAAHWKDAPPLLSDGSLSRGKRQVPCEPGDELDEYVDSLFRFASRIVRAMEPIGLPNATVELPEYNLKLFLYKGGASRAYSLQRKKSAWVYCTNESISLGLTVGFNDLRVKYKYRAIFDWNLLFDGELEANLQGTKAQVQFTQTTPDDDSEEEVQQRVDRVRIWRLGRIRVILKGLGNLTQAVSMLLTRALNSNQEQLDPTLRRLESEAIVTINEMLKNISVPFFSIV
ncbi:uncharacterized protein LOC128387371 [Panonychus citri]|uniref:uncharacterized protein LOC128387371 n=1 Tax=Panonychus citri TaxID=50023 RepID=UPI0023076AA5|nr:uncharacterized protein LOC128387371 [Panonychus citri]XP_053202541.1 uncharacterized protein LOC128387371 [Panonychus citri]